MLIFSLKVVWNWVTTCSAREVLYLLLIACTVHSAYTILYNVFFHPLRKVPGPWIYATSRVPYITAVVTGQLAVKFHELHEQYGPVVRTASNEVSFIDPEAWDTMYTKKNPSHHEFPKNYDTWNETANSFTRTLFLASNNDHSRMRRVLSPSFCEGMLRNYEAPLRKHVDNFLHGIERSSQSRPGEVLTNFKRPVDLNDWFNWLTFDSTSEFVLGESFHCLKDPSHRDWLKHLSSTWHFISIVSSLKSFGRTKDTFSFLLPRKRLQRYVDQLALVGNTAAQRLYITHTQPTMMSVSQSVRKEREAGRTRQLYLSEGETVANAALVVTAGTDTSATVLPALVYLLSTHQDAWQKAVEEVRSFSSEEDLITHCTNAMPYLSACIQETLRFYSPVPEGLPRVCPGPGQEICGYWIPGGTCCQVSIHAANRSSANFVEADKFLPERWLSPEHQTASRFARDRRSAFRPFSTGPRNCIGQNLALKTIKMSVSRLLFRFDIQYAKNDDWCNQRSYLLWQRRPMMVNLRPVNARRPKGASKS